MDFAKFIGKKEMVQSVSQVCLNEKRPQIGIDPQINKVKPHLSMF